MLYLSGYKRCGRALPLPTVVQDLWDGLGEIRSTRSFNAGSCLFAEGDPSSCVYLIESGQVRIEITDDRGRTRILSMAGPGTLLGLSEAVGGELHKVSVLSVGQTETSYVRRTDLLEFLVKQPRLCMEIVRLLSEDLHCLYQEFRHLQATPGVRVRRRTADGRFQ